MRIHSFLYVRNQEYETILKVASGYQILSTPSFLRVSLKLLLCILELYAEMPALEDQGNDSQLSQPMSDSGTYSVSYPMNRHSLRRSLKGLFQQR